MSDPLATTNPRRAWHDGRAAGRAEVAVVLLDLIAEVYAAHDRDDLYYTAAARESLMVSATDRAEARLREVTGE